MGLQNGIGTTFSGGFMRTTHMTGAFTDLGLNIGRLVGRRAKNALVTRKCVLNSEEGRKFERKELQRAQLLLVLIIGFIGGSVIGANVVRNSIDQKSALLLPAVADIALGLAYFTYRVVYLKQPLLGEAREETNKARAESYAQTRLYSPVKRPRPTDNKKLETMDDLSI